MIKLFLGAVVSLGLLGATALAWQASRTGIGLPGLLDEPVSVRQESVRGTTGSRGPAFIYFGRTHLGGGYQGGK